jgi:hypothetical protein
MKKDLKHYHPKMPASIIETVAATSTRNIPQKVGAFSANGQMVVHHGNYLEILKTPTPLK